MSSAFNISRALAAAEAHGRQEGTALQATGVQDSHRLWPGRGGGSWFLSKPDTYIFFLSCGRSGRDDLCRGGWQLLFLHSKNAMDLIQRDLTRQKAVRVISLSETNFLRYLWIFLDIWYAGAGRVLSQAEGSPLLQYFRHARRFIEAGPNIGGNHGEPAWRSGGRRAVRPPTVHPHGEKGYEISERLSVFGIGAEDEKYQILIKTLSGKTILVWVFANDTGEKLKDQIAQREGYPRLSFYILYRGKVLPEGNTLRDYQINKNSTLHVLFRLRGGMNGNRGTTGPTSYKDAARSKGPQAEATPNVQPSPYIVEKLDSIPMLEIKNDQVKGLFSSLQAEAVICRFNGFWPKSQDLYAWIYQNWTTHCQILLCSKGFFIVLFDSSEEYQQVLSQGPWFWGRAGLFLTPWFPEFDANTMVVTKMPVWVRLPNLPLPFWPNPVLEDIGNLLGRFIKSDNERKDKGLFTYARICVEIDLSKGLPDRIYLKHESYNWLQILDYENTAFRCRCCNLTGHLQDTCPLAKKFPKKKKGPMPNRKSWQADYAPYPEEEEGRVDKERQGVQSKEETMVHENAEAQTTGKQTPGEDTQPNLENLEDVSASRQEHMGDSLLGEGTQTALVIHKEASTNGFKRGHESEKSDSDKEHASNQKPEMVNGRQVIVATTSQGRWMEVKNKRKGKKGKIEAYYQP